MDATKVLSQLTNTWTTCLDEYYDHVAKEHLKMISEKYNIPIEDLNIKSKEMKEGIMKKLTNCIPSEKVEQTEKPKKQEKEKNLDQNLESLGRKNLQNMCKERGIPTKRKNADMVDAIKEYDLKNKVEIKEEPKKDEVQNEEEPEVQNVNNEKLYEVENIEEDHVDQVVQNVNEEDYLPEHFNDINLDDSDNDLELQEDEYEDEEY